MDDLTFLETFSEQGERNATLKAVLADGQVCHISDDICPYKFLDKCPLLYHAFEHGVRSRLQASIEAPSASAVISLLRYCYTGSYMSPFTEYGPISLLPHVEIYKMALDFDVIELQAIATGNFACQIEFSCSLPDPPQDLLQTITFIYHHFADPQSRQQHGIVATLLNYCISIFQYHQLGDRLEFLNLVSEIPDFRQDLCRTNMERNFQDECAFTIIRLALDTPQAPSAFRPTLLASRDLPQEMLYDIPKVKEEDSATQDLSQAMFFDHLTRRLEDLSDSVMTAFRDGDRNSDSDAADEAVDTNSSAYPATGPMTLVHRPRNPFLDPYVDFEAESSSDEDGFSLVHRPRPWDPTDAEELMSSPEMLPATTYVQSEMLPTTAYVQPETVDVLAMTGSDYPSDDEWTLLDA